MTHVDRVLTAALAMGLLAGCVTFESAPVADMGCDGTLTGRWLFPGVENEAPGHVRPEATVTADCKVTVTGRDGKTRTGSIGTFEFEGHRYLSAEMGKPDTVLDTSDKVIETWPATRVMLLRYRREGDLLLVWAINDEALAMPTDARVTVHSDATIDAATGKPQPAVFPDRYVSGERQQIASLLRSNGDALYPKVSVVMSLATERTTP